MNEIRRNPISDDLVIIASERGMRPQEFSAATPPPPTAEECPFCPGNEHETPTTVAAYRRGSPCDLAAPNWDVRVVPNRYPAVSDHVADSDLVPNQVTGVHEVVIDTRRHVARFPELTASESEQAIAGLVSRAAEVGQREDIAAVHMFKNTGRQGGASIYHSHSQLLATAFIPPRLQKKLDRFRQHSDCLLCGMLDQEQHRHVARTEHLVAFCPSASRFPYETWIAPRAHHSRLETCPLEQFRELAHLIREITGSLDDLCQFPGINLVFSTAPFDSHAYDYYHWHVEVCPRLTIQAGFELSSGITINPIDPDFAAHRLCR